MDTPHPSHNMGDGYCAGVREGVGWVRREREDGRERKGRKGRRKKGERRRKRRGGGRPTKGEKRKAKKSIGTGGEVYIVSTM